jgi:hypothetical protein
MRIEVCPPQAARRGPDALKVSEALLRAAADDAQPAAALAAGRVAEIRLPGQWPRRLRLWCQLRATAGFALTVAGRDVLLEASDRREFVAGVGRLLALLRVAADAGQALPQGHWHEEPQYPVRLHYMPGHFGNSFEVAWPAEMKRYVEDLALWGSSGYADWFDPNDMPDPYRPQVYCSTSMSLWQRKKEVLRAAQDLGLDLALAITHNVGFTDQLRPEWVGVRSHRRRVQGQVLCPSIPAARQVCLDNQEHLFCDLAEAGLRLNKLIYAPYDDGGCACDRCQPYYPTFLGMVAQIHDIARRYFPDVRADLCGWWVTDEEMQQVHDFARGPAREWFGAFQFSATYDVFALPDVRPRLGDLPLSSFFHLGFSHDNRDVYIRTGVHAAPRRIQSVIQSFAAQQCLGFNAYNESFGDHFNQFLASQLGRNPDADIAALAADYVRQVFSLRGTALARVVDVLLAMEQLDAAQAEGWMATLRSVQPAVRTPPRQAWVFAQVQLKAELMALDHRIGSGRDWRDEADLAPVASWIARRLELSETLWREVYGLGVLRHIFIAARMLPGWYESYRRLCPLPPDRIRPGSALSHEA